MVNKRVDWIEVRLAPWYEMEFKSKLWGPETSDTRLLRRQNCLLFVSFPLSHWKSFECIALTESEELLLVPASVHFMQSVMHTFMFSVKQQISHVVAHAHVCESWEERFLFLFFFRTRCFSMFVQWRRQSFFCWFISFPAKLHLLSSFSRFSLVLCTSLWTRVHPQASSF